MRKKICKIYECSEGDIIASDVYTSSGVFIVPARTAFNEYIRMKLESLNVRQIEIYDWAGSSKVSSGSDDENLKRDYCEKVNIIKSVFLDIAAGRELNLAIIASIAESIYSEIYSNYDLAKCISFVKDADKYTYTHCLNVSIYCMFIAKWLKMNDNEIKDVIKSGLLHDIGKAKIPQYILNKCGPLDDDEFEIMKKHPELGYELIYPISSIGDKIKKAVLMHHERENGSGYPMGLHSEEIEQYAKIVAIADIYDALTTKRVYRPKLTPFDTFKEIESIAMGENLYDLKILLSFLTNISTYYIGAKIKLNDNRYGEIVYIPPYDISNPIIKIDNKYINIKNEPELKITEVL